MYCANQQRRPAEAAKHGLSAHAPYHKGFAPISTADASFRGKEDKGEKEKKEQERENKSFWNRIHFVVVSWRCSKDPGNMVAHAPAKTGSGETSGKGKTLGIAKVSERNKNREKQGWRLPKTCITAAWDPEVVRQYPLVLLGLQKGKGVRHQEQVQGEQYAGQSLGSE